MLFNKRFVGSLIVVCFMVVFVGTTAVQTAEASDFKIAGSTPEIITSVPRAMTYQCILKDDDKEPFADSNLDINFSIYNDPDIGYML